MNKSTKTEVSGHIGPLLASTGISVTGDGAFIAAAPLLAASLTTSPLEVSVITATFYAPWLIAGLPAGALVDRWPRRPVMLAADIARAGVLAVLAFMVSMRYENIALLSTAVFIVGVAQCFFDSAAQAVIPLLVGRGKEALARANGRYWSLDTVGRSLAGPPIGSATFTISRMLPFAADAASFAVSAVFISRLPTMPAITTSSQPIGVAIRAGLRHLRNTRELLLMAVSMSTYNFAYNISMATFVLYATKGLHVADAGYGGLLAASAVGGMLSGWLAAPITRNLSHRHVMGGASLVQGLVWVAIALSSCIYVTGFFLALLGAASALTSVAVGSARQALTPDDLLGRVVSAFRLFGIGAAALGALLGGLVADIGGLRAPMWAAAALAVLVSVVVWTWRRNEEGDQQR